MGEVDPKVGYPWLGWQGCPRTPRRWRLLLVGLQIMATTVQQFSNIHLCLFHQPV